jgi:hypothetical protein
MKIGEYRHIVADYNDPPRTRAMQRLQGEFPALYGGDPITPLPADFWTRKAKPRLQPIGRHRRIQPRRTIPRFVAVFMLPVLGWIWLAERIAGRR